jgi:hypothetical protein
LESSARKNLAHFHPETTYYLRQVVGGKSTPAQQFVQILSNFSLGVVQYFNARATFK